MLIKGLKVREFACWYSSITIGLYDFFHLGMLLGIFKKQRSGRLKEAESVDLGEDVISKSLHMLNKLVLLSPGYLGKPIADSVEQPKHIDVAEHPIRNYRIFSYPSTLFQLCFYSFAASRGKRAC